MGVPLLILVLFMGSFLLLAGKLAALLTIVVACATFSFPVGLIGMVGIGVSLLFLMTPRNETD